ncbi:AAA family ATPase [Paenimyroides ceti]
MGAYLDKIEFSNIKLFKDKYLIDFNLNDRFNQWNVILGNNNVGKTNLLKIISLADGERNIFPSINGVDKNVYILNYSLIGNFIYDNKLKITNNEYENSSLDITYKILDGSKENLNISLSSKGGGSINGSNKIKKLVLAAYGTNRITDKKNTISNDLVYFNNSLIKKRNLIDFENWLTQLDYTSKSSSASHDIINEAVAKKKLLIDLLISEIFPEIEEIRFVSDKELNNYVEYFVKGEWNKFSDLGFGYQTTLAWVFDFSKILFDNYPNSSNPLKEPAILLIDELDLHLHPAWQRSITKILSDIFTKTQFIITTHSPFILQSLKDFNLIVLNKKNNKVEIESHPNSNFKGWSVEEILSEIMQLNKDVNSDYYQELISEFNSALDNNEKDKANLAYEKLMRILHPNNPERKLLKMQLSQFVS